MELAAVPRRPRRARPWLLVVLIVVVPVTALALVPAAFGLERYVVAGEEMSAPFGRGSTVWVQQVPAGDVAAGDVVTYDTGAATSPTGPTVGALAGSSPVLETRRVVQVTEDALFTSGDTGGTVHRLALTAHPTIACVVVAIPLAGYPFLGLLGQPLWAAALLGLGAVVLGLALWRRPARRRAGRGARASRAGRGEPVAAGSVT